MRRASPCGHASKSERAPPSGAAADGSPCDAFEASRAHARPRRTPFVICTARQPRPGHGHRTVSGESQDGRTTELQAGAGLGTGAAHQVTRTRPRATRASRNLRACPLPPAPCPCHCQAVCHGRRLEVIGFATPAARGRSPPCIEASDTLGRLVATGPLSQALRQRTAWSNDGRCRDERRMCRWQLVRASNARARALGRVARELREPPMTIWHPL